MKEFKKLVKGVMETLPKEFYQYLDNVVVEVADDPDDDLLLRAGFTMEEIEEGHTLLGFFDPLELPTAWAGDSVDTQDMLHRLWVFRLPHMDEFPEPEQCRIEVRKTVIHELGHHFGFDEEDIARWDANPNPFKE